MSACFWAHMDLTNLINSVCQQPITILKNMLACFWAHKLILIKRSNSKYYAKSIHTLRTYYSGIAE